MSGYFGLVAICVTHPLCPIRVPRRWSVSVIFVKCKNLLFHVCSLPQANVKRKTTALPDRKSAWHAEFAIIHNSYAVRFSVNRCNLPVTFASTQRWNYLNDRSYLENYYELKKFRYDFIVWVANFHYFDKLNSNKNYLITANKWFHWIWIPITVQIGNSVMPSHRNVEPLNAKCCPAVCR